jgi:outer membrane protein assembly factor BamB
MIRYAMLEMILGRDEKKNIGNVADIDGYVYGIPYASKQIIKFDPVSHNTSILGDESRIDFQCIGGVFGRDGCIYSLSYKHDKVLKIDVVNNTYYQVYNVHSTFYNYYWSEAVLGNDGCIYWPPLDDYHTLKFDTETQTISRIGDHLGELEH